MKKCLVMILTFCVALGVCAQDVKDELLKNGFENVAVAISNDTVYAVIEDPRYRGTFRGAANALKIIAQNASGCTHYELVVEEYMIPKVAVHSAMQNGVWTVEVDYNTRACLKQLKALAGGKRTITNGWKSDDGIVSMDKESSAGKVDITFYPMLTLNNHEFTQLYRYGVFLAPSIETTLWKGGRITIQPIIPIVNNFKDTSLSKHFQLGVVSLQQEFVNNGKWWAKAAVGTFRTNRLGVNVDAGVKLTKTLDLSFVANVTEASANMGEEWYFGEEYGLYAHAKLDWFEPRTLLQTQLSVGRFMYGDYGARVDVSRHFGEYVVGLYGVYTKGKNNTWMKGEHNAGFHFTIPFGGKSQYRRGYVRLKLPEYYNMEYSMVSYYAYAREHMGSSLIDRPDMNRSAHYWQAAYIQRYLLKELNDNSQR